MTTHNSHNGNISEILGIDTTNTRKRRWHWWLVLAALLVIAAASWLLLGLRENSSAMRYKTEPVRQGDLTVTVTATGTLQPTNTVEVGSELSGIAKTVEADYNSTVTVGQILARLDTAKLEASITQARASLESAKAKVLQTRATVAETQATRAQLQKVKELSGGKLPSQQEMDAAEAALLRAKADEAAAEAAVSQARAVLESNETDLAKSAIRSPINGIVLSRSIEPGQTVAASFQAPVLFTLAEDLTKMELHVDVDEADIGQIEEGQKASFNVAAWPNRTFEAHITQARYGATTTSGVVTYETLLRVENPDLSLRPGMTATADITVREIFNAVLVPGAGLRFSPPATGDEQSSSGLIGSILPGPPQRLSQTNNRAIQTGKNQRVWIVRSGKLVAIPITTGASSGGWTEVIAGDLEPGMEIVVDRATTTR